MRPQKCRRPRPTAPPPSREEKGNESTSSALSAYEILSSRLIGSKRALTLRRPRPQGDPPRTAGQTPRQGGLTITEDVFCPARIADLNPSMGDEANGRSEKRTEDGLELSAVDPGEEVQQRRSSTSGSRSIKEFKRSVEKNPLKHNGRWVPPEYIYFKESGRTGYWTCCGNKSSYSTHCPDFDARMCQREADYLQGLADHVARIRRQASKKIRARWENRIHKTSSMKKTSIEKVAGADSPRSGKRTRRPFLRQKWLDRLNKVGEASTDLVVEAGGARNNFLDSSTTLSFGVKRRIVERDHIRSVVQLARSEARVNAFVVISAFEGLLDVLALENGKEAPTICAGDQSIGQKITGDTSYEGSPISHPSQRGYIGFARTFPTEFARNTEDPRAIFMPESRPAERTQRSVTTVANTTSCTSGSSNGDESCSGAKLCVKLGALPVVLGCMDEHADDIRIEHLGIKLLRIFAKDDSTREAIAGNTDVVKICVARITHFPPAGVAARGDDMVDLNIPRCSFTREQHATRTNYLDHGGRPECAERHQAPRKATSGITVGSKDQDLDRSCKSNPGDVTVVPQSRTKTSSTLATIELENRGASTVRGTPRAFQSPRSDDATRRTEPILEATGPGVTEGTIATDCDSMDSTDVVADGARDVGIPVKPTRVISRLLFADLASVLSVALDCSSKCQDLVREHRISTIMLATVRRTGPDDGNCILLTSTCLRVLELVGMGAKERRKLVAEGCVETTVSIIDRFRSHHEVLVIAMRLLLLLSDTDNGRSRILKTGGIRVVLAAMRRLVGNTPLQVMVIDMLDTMVIEEPNARRELDGIKGGWQWLCQGTPGGGSLLRYIPGEKHTPGWTVSEEERISTSEALATPELVAPEWTPGSLATFMGRIADPTHSYYFRVLTETNLLPHAFEDVGKWRERTRRYENERRVRLFAIARRRLGRDHSRAYARSSTSSAASLFTS